MSEFLEISRAAIEALARGETVCLATVVRVRGSAPRHMSARMLIWPDGKTFGTIGGGTLEHRVIGDARAALADSLPLLKNYLFDTRGGPESVGLCGGSVDIHMDVLWPDPTLLIIGAGNIAQPLAKMAASLAMRVIVVDNRLEWANRERLPHAAAVFLVDDDEDTEILAPIPEPITPFTYVVITTQGYDLPALEQALAGTPAFVGLVASPAKFRELSKKLLKKGVVDESLQRIHTPVGLDIGAETPAEVALSILAEVLAVQRGGSGLPLREKNGKILEKALVQDVE
jgi:xanthine dehydrogenase accessory factor